jgi:hypothetical protein
MSVYEDTDLENTIVTEIHTAICEDDLDEHMSYGGACTKAATAVGTALKGWHVAEWPVDGQNVPLLHSECCDEPGEYVEIVNEETVADILHTIATHDCEEER